MQSYSFRPSFKIFQSTLPVRGATVQPRRGGPCLGISIHAPREGSDLGDLCLYGPLCIISIHAPREGSDLHNRSEGQRGSTDFNPRSP